MDKSQYDVRHARSEDIEQIYTILQQESVYTNTLQYPHVNSSWLKSKLANTQENNINLVVTKNSQVIANGGFEICTRTRRKHTATLFTGVTQKKDCVNYNGIKSSHDKHLFFNSISSL